MTDGNALLFVSPSEAALEEWMSTVDLGLLGCMSMGDNLPLRAVVGTALTLEGESLSDRFSLLPEEWKSMGEEGF